MCNFVALYRASTMNSESCHESASHLKEGVLGLRVTLGNDMFGLIDGAPDVVLCGSESDGEMVGG
jgi:hypothetical protein